MKLSIFLIGVIFFTGLISCNRIKHTQGERIFQSQCANCHMNDGTGLKGHIPSIVNSDYIKGEKTKIISLIYHGINAEKLGQVDNYMPSHKKMTDTEMNNLLNFIQEYFNEGKYEYNLQDIISIRKELSKK
jgi:mono/diheme cytochrome c family protein